MLMVKMRIKGFFEIRILKGKNEDKIFTLLKDKQPHEEVNGIKNKMTMKTISKLSKTCIKDNDIVWNFTKFLIDREGNVVKRYSPITSPLEIEEDLLKLI